MSQIPIFSPISLGEVGLFKIDFLRADHHGRGIPSPLLQEEAILFMCMCSDAQKVYI